MVGSGGQYHPCIISYLGISYILRARGLTTRSKQRPASHVIRYSNDLCFMLKAPSTSDSRTAVKQGRLHSPHDPTVQIWRLEIPRKRTCEYHRSLRVFSRAHQVYKPIARPCVRRFTSIYIHTSHFSKQTDITLQDVPNREYTLRLFVENVERELQRKDDHTWTPVQRQYAPLLPQCIRTLTHWR